MTADFAFVAYQDARFEILERVKMRDRWIALYVTGTFTLIGISLGAEFESRSIRIALSSVMPIASLIVALNIAAHNTAIEKLADYLRTDLNDFLASRGEWAPYWDWYTRKGGQDVEKKKTGQRLWAHIVSVHFPSILSLFIGGASFLEEGEGCFCAFEVWEPHPGWLLLLGFLSLLLAFYFTWKSLAERGKSTFDAAMACPREYNSLLHDQPGSERVSKMKNTHDCKPEKSSPNYGGGATLEEALSEKDRASIKTCD